jgi:hypothetical protein
MLQQLLKHNLLKKENSQMNAGVQLMEKKFLEKPILIGMVKIQQLNVYLVMKHQ